MPKSKRSTVVSLTKTDKKGREGKEKLINDVQECVDNYSYLYLFSVKDMRNTFLKEIRNDFKDSRFFYGKNRVMAKGLGTSPETEYKEGLSGIAKDLSNEVGMLFTNKDPKEVQTYFDEFVHPDYARSGAIATQTVTLPEGPVKRGADPMPHNMEPLIRSLGMPTSLKNGIVTLLVPYTICTEGETLTTNQAHLLKLFYHQLAEFKVDLISYYHQEKQRLKNIEQNKELLSQLGIDSARTEIAKANPLHSSKTRPVPTIPRTANKKKELVRPIRKSLRLKGEDPQNDEVADLNVADTLENKAEFSTSNASDHLLAGEEYFDEEIKKKAIRVDGHFRSWVNPVIMHKYGIEASAREAWEKNGGGTFSYADSTGLGKKRKKGTVSNAKADALKMFKKNPNQYFYRHNEPGEEQWLHDWSAQEQELFLEIVRQHGCGDKWGLFATYIPHRVGYQCSNFYRQVVLKNGLVFDPNYMILESTLLLEHLYT
ncbi:hypothetical protein G6F59_006784 [Rhizopus arrhizus]|nr:hypothetical protein G6F34_001420 [Rhizopus arrhizus]KAG1071448.1 hypothetical protein G6F41_004314 [Rhizopus arrhizus]KAG1421315.1 hypothetical protein G6F59_006784 [Rhizopus arrhizus]